MKTWLKYGIIGAIIGLVCFLIAFISDQFISCNGITITSDGSCHSLVTQLLGDVFYFISFPVSLGIVGIPEGPGPLMLWIFSGIVFLFIYGAIIGVIAGKIGKRKK